MGRPKGDEKYRNEVIIIEENKKWQCKHCNRLFNSGFSRIKYHLDKTRGKGISICSVYQNKEGASSSIDPQQLMNTLNPSQAHQGAAGMIDTTGGGGGSINHQTNRESSYLLGGAWGTIDHQTNIESSSLLRVAEGPHEMIDGGLIDQRNNTQLTLQVAEGPHNMIDGGSIDQQNNPQSIALLEAHQDAPGMIDTTVGGDSINHQTNTVSSLINQEITCFYDSIFGVFGCYFNFSHTFHLSLAWFCFMSAGDREKKKMESKGETWSQFWEDLQVRLYARPCLIMHGRAYL